MTITATRARALLARPDTTDGAIIQRLTNAELREINTLRADRPCATVAEVLADVATEEDNSHD